MIYQLTAGLLLDGGLDLLYELARYLSLIEISFEELWLSHSEGIQSYLHNVYQYGYVVDQDLSLILIVVSIVI